MESISASHQAGHRIGGTRPRGHQHHADLSGAAGVAFGRVHRAAFLAHQDVADGVLLEQRVVDRQYRAAGISEDDLDALVLQGAEEDFCSRLGGFCRHGRAPGKIAGAPISRMVRCVKRCLNKCQGLGVVPFQKLLSIDDRAWIVCVRSGVRERMMPEPGGLALGVLPGHQFHAACRLLQVISPRRWAANSGTPCARIAGSVGSSPSARSARTSLDRPVSAA